MQHKYQIVKTAKVGYAIQNTTTYSIVGLYKKKQDAERVCANLNAPAKPEAPPKVYHIQEG